MAENSTDSTTYKNDVTDMTDTTNNKKIFPFLIAGVTYKLKTSHDDRTVQELVDYVNLKMDQAMKATKNGSFQNAAVLAALNIAEELILLKRKAVHELNRLEEKAVKLTQDLENSKKTEKSTQRVSSVEL